MDDFSMLVGVQNNPADRFKSHYLGAPFCMSVTISACDEDNMLELMRLYRSVTRQIERGQGLDDLFVNARSRRIFSMPFPSGMKKYESVVYNLFKTLRSLTGGDTGVTVYMCVVDCCSFDTVKPGAVGPFMTAMARAIYVHRLRSRIPSMRLPDCDARCNPDENAKYSPTMVEARNGDVVKAKPEAESMQPMISRNPRNAESGTSRTQDIATPLNRSPGLPQLPPPTIRKSKSAVVHRNGRSSIRSGSVSSNSTARSTTSKSSNSAINEEGAGEDDLISNNGSQSTPGDDDAESSGDDAWKVARERALNR